MTKREWLEKAEGVKSDAIKSIVDDLLSHEARRNPYSPLKREVTIPWDEVESYLEKLIEIDGRLNDAERETGSLSKGFLEG